ncbi:hypothetical protein F5Y02DRAFT_128297 [Annulohypoxylon stygium]|nr:hypothetical protein F5Y02DRAFT_128297 [Annulohypoxylon stygium]
MPINQRLSINLIPNDDAPAKPTPLDAAIAGCGGSSARIDTTPRRLQLRKDMSILSLPEAIAQNGRLREELAFEQRKSAAGAYLADEIKRVAESLRQALVDFHNLAAALDNWNNGSE